ncbi:MAG: hypothetical protein ACI959_002247 [Limisphaerales bacterium]
MHCRLWMADGLAQVIDKMYKTEDKLTMTMYDFVKSITSQFGGRLAGSKEELDAQYWIKNQFEELTDNVVLDNFESALTAKFHSLKIFCSLWYISLLIVWFSPAAAAIISGLSAFVFLGHFVFYQDWLDPFYEKIKSCNVTAVIEPQEEVHSTIMIAGHVDSANEFQWWRKFGEKGAPYTVVGSLVLVLGAIFLIILASSSAILNPQLSVWTVLWLIFVILTPFTITLFSMHGPYGPVDGAIDNLSGVAIAWGIGKHFLNKEVAGQKGKSILRHTRLKLVCFGSEECGLKGSRAYIAQHESELKAEKTILLNMESFKDDKHLTILSGELFTGAKYPKVLTSALENAFKSSGIKSITTVLPIGATDSTSFYAGGIPTTCVIGLNSEKMDPTYHTRLDNVSNLDPVGMESMVKVLDDFINVWDKNEELLNVLYPQ